MNSSVANNKQIMLGEVRCPFCCINKRTNERLNETGYSEYGLEMSLLFSVTQNKKLEGGVQRPNGYDSYCRGIMRIKKNHISKVLAGWAGMG